MGIGKIFMFIGLAIFAYLTGMAIYTTIKFPTLSNIIITSILVLIVLGILWILMRKKKIVERRE